MSPKILNWRQRITWVICLAALAGLALGACEPGAPTPELELDPAEAVQAQAAVALAEAAIAAYEEDPDATMAEISASGGRWQIGELYVFVLDPNAVIVAHAANAELNGADFSQVTDSDGYLFTPGLVERADENGGWDVYRFTNPATGQAEPKRAYVRRIDGGLIFGVGYYLDETRFIKHIVNDAVAVWETDPDPLARLQSESRFNRGESYVFVVRARDLISLATQAEPELVGTSLADLTDYTGKKVALDARARADADGEWIYYGYLNPINGAEQDKQSWVVRSGDAIIGAGIFSPR